jgi:signal transduction histidine kinase
MASTYYYNNDRMSENTTVDKNGITASETTTPARRRFWLPVLLVLALGIGAFGWFAYETLRETPRTSAEQARKLGATALAALSDEVTRLVYELSWSDSTLGHVQPKLDIVWTKNNIGANLHRDYAVEFSAVYGSKGDVVIAYNAGRRVFPHPLGQVSGDIRALVERAREASMRQPNPAVGYIRIDGALKIAAASAVTPRNPTPEQLIRYQRPVLLIWRAVDDALLADLGRKFGLDRLSLKPPAQTAAPPSLNLVSPLGATVGRAYYSGEDTTTPRIKNLILIFSGLLAAVLLIGWAFVARTQRENQRLVQQAEQQAANDAARTAAATAEPTNGKALDMALLATVSHELKTPLNLIIGFSDVLLKKGRDADPDETAQQLGFIHDAANQQLEIVNDILDAAKLQAGKMEMDIESFAFDDLLQEIRTTANELMLEHDNVLEIEVTNQIGTLKTDRIKLRQTLLNLLGNAAKFTEKGLIRLTARRIPDENGSEVEFSVSDTGIGMTPEEANRVFDAFVQADSAINRKFRGTGLGLTIAQQFTKLLGGDIALETTPEIGSTFVLRIPAENVTPVTVPEEDEGPI